MSQHASAPAQQPSTPVAVRWAAGLLAVYSLMVLAHVFTLSPRDSEFDASLLRTAIGRMQGAAAMAWGVARGRSWGRWLTLALGGLWAGFCALALVEYAGTPAVAPRQTLVFGPVGIMALLLLGGAIGCLLVPRSRLWFRRAAV